jgi:ribosome-binding factor A
MALTHRVERIQEQVREEVSQMLQTEVRDPGVGLVTVTRAKVTADLSLARIYWTIIGDAAERKKTQQALERASGFVRHLLAERLTLRRSPEVKFIFDQSVAAQDRIEQIIQEIHAEDAARTVQDPEVIATTANSVDTTADAVDTVVDGKDDITVKNDEPDTKPTPR